MENTILFKFKMKTCTKNSRKICFESFSYLVPFAIAASCSAAIHVNRFGLLLQRKDVGRRRKWKFSISSSFWMTFLLFVRGYLNVRIVCSLINIYVIPNINDYILWILMEWCIVGKIFIRRMTTTYTNAQKWLLITTIRPTPKKSISSWLLDRI